MMQTLYYPDFYKNITTEEIKRRIEKEGFDPILFSNGPGEVYSPHSHPETKLLVFLDGTMEVTVDGKKYQCNRGDKLVIPGNITHSAIAGGKGCTFFWSEKLI